MGRRSRREKRFEKDVRKNLLFSLFGIAVLIFILFKFGIPLLVNFSLLISGSSKSSQEQRDSLSFVNAPILDPLPSATNSAKIVISGKSKSNAEIELYINEGIVDKTLADSKGGFEFEQTLFEGSNKIYLRAKDDGKESDLSQSFEVLLDEKAPEITIDSPSDGQSFSKDQKIAQVLGKTEEGVKITVNGFRAIVNDNQNFSYNLPLQNGENRIKVVAEDQAGNRMEKEIKVTYSP